MRSGPVTVRGGELRVRRGDAALAAKIDRVRWDGLRDTPTQLAVTATAPSGGKLAIDGPVRVDPFSADLAVHAEGLAFAPWAELLKLPVAVERGALTGTAHIDYTDRLRSLRGEIQAIDVHTRPPDPARPTEVLAVATAAASFSFTPGEPGAIDMPSLTLSYPYAMVVRSAAGTFPSTLLGGGAAAARRRRSGSDGSTSSMASSSSSTRRCSRRSGRASPTSPPPPSRWPCRREPSTTSRWRASATSSAPSRCRAPTAPTASARGSR